MSEPLLRQSGPILGSSQFTVGAVVVLVFAKTIAYVYSESAAVLSTLIDSITDVGLSCMTLMALRFSARPADLNHRYGHGKIEGISALLQAAFLMGGATFLIFESLSRLIAPVEMHDHLFAMAMLGFSALVSLLVAYVQKRALKQHDSLALEADLAHYSSDAWINLIALAVVLATYLQWAPPWVDAASALIIAALLCRAAYGIGTQAFGMLLDTELPDEVRTQIFAVVRGQEGVVGLHDLRTHQSGNTIFMSFDMEVDADLSLWSAHEIAVKVEKCLLQQFPSAEILIHLDPAGSIEDARHYSQKDPHA